MSQRFSWRKASTEAQLLLVGIPLLLWTLIPVYHLFLFAISSKDQATSGRLWPENPTLQNFRTVFYQEHFYLNHFWHQLLNSVVIALSVAPQLIESIQRVHRARRLRGDSARNLRALRTVAMPVLADAIDRSLALAACNLSALAPEPAQAVRLRRPQMRRILC